MLEDKYRGTIGESARIMKNEKIRLRWRKIKKKTLKTKCNGVGMLVVIAVTHKHNTRVFVS